MPFDVFLCHNSADKPEVAAVAAALEGRGLRVFLDDREMAPGTVYDEHLTAALDRSRTVAVFVGRHGLGDYQLQESRSALAKSRQDGNQTRVYLALLPGGKLDSILATDPLRQRTLVEFGALQPGDERFERPLDDFVWAVTNKKPPPRQVSSAPPAPQVVSGADLDVDLIDQFKGAVQARGVALLLGRSWAGEADVAIRGSQAADELDETYVLGRQLLAQLLPAPAGEQILLPPLDDIASCFRTRRGADRLEAELLQALTGAACARAPAAVEACLGEFLHQQLQRRTGGAAVRGGSGPLVMTTGLGMALETLLLRRGLPFLRLVACRSAKAGPSITVHDCTDAGFLALARQRLQDTADDGLAASVVELMRSAPLHQADAQPVEDIVARQSVPCIVLLKCLGSIDVDNSCVVTRANIVDCALTFERGGAGATLVRSVLVSRAILIAGFRPLDVDFGFLDNLVIRPAMAHADERNPCLMVVAPTPAGGPRRSRFLADEVEQQGAAALRRSLTSSRIQPLDVSLPTLLDHFGHDGP